MLRSSKFSESEKLREPLSRTMRSSAIRAPDPSHYQTAKAIHSAVRGGANVGIPTVVYYLVALAIALPTVSFFAMHARMLDRQEVLSRNFAVRFALLSRPALFSRVSRFVWLLFVDTI